MIYEAGKPSPGPFDIYCLPWSTVNPRKNFDQPPTIAEKVEQVLTVKCLCLFRTSLKHPQRNQHEVRPFEIIEG